MSKRRSQAEGSSGVSEADWRGLYDEIGEHMAMASSTANDMTTPDAVTLRLNTKVEALSDVREQMRAIDSTLPLEEVDQP